MIKDCNSNFECFTPISESNHNFLREKTPFSLAKTSSSFKEIKNNEVPKISNFSEIFKPKPMIDYKFCSNSSNNFKSFIPVFNNITIDSFKKIKDNFDLLSPKKATNKKDSEIFLKNSKNINYILINEKENTNNLNLSAFKEIEINNKEQNIHNSAFKKQLSFNKIILNNKINKKKLKNKIIINETNNISKNSENNNNSNKKFKIFNSIRIKNNQEKNSDKELFYLKKKRGRKSIIKVKRVHNASDYDNILRKIQVHFLTFIIYFTNDLIDTFLPDKKNLRFKNLDYEFKKPVNHSYVQNLKNRTIGEILQLKASSKNRKFESSVNHETYIKICEICPILRNFFKLSFITVFNNYYYQNMRIFSYEGKTVNISQRTKLFIDLLAKNSEAADKIQHIASTNYIEEHKNNNNKTPIFIINKNK